MKKRGFTLIELLIVITIVGILLAIATASYLTALKQSRDTRRKTDLEQIRQALETYRSENGTYPAASGWSDTLKAGYIGVVPTDPLTHSLYFYNHSGGSSTYTLCTTLEIVPSQPVAICDSAIYNYELTNP